VIRSPYYGETIKNHPFGLAVRSHWIGVIDLAQTNSLSLYGAGVAASIIFAVTGTFVVTKPSGFPDTFLGSPVGFASWQIAVGSLIVRMSSKVPEATNPPTNKILA